MTCTTSRDRTAGGARPLARALRVLVPALALVHAATAAGQLPESPAIAPDVRSAADGGRSHGYVSARRSTHDGRVRITGNAEAGHKLHTSRLEQLSGRLADERRPTDGGRVPIDPASFHASTGHSPEADHVAICDPYLAEGAVKNPYACRHANRPADCYDVEILQMVHVAKSAGSSAGRRSEIWSTPVTITVRRPKTAAAAIAKLELRGPPVRSPIRTPPRKSGEILAEPVVSGDGRLLFLNSNNTLLYSVMGPGRTPCDARNWTRLAHVSEMHRDPAMKRYGVARYPIRDSENRRVKTGRPLRGAYPWIDRKGRNLFFTQVGGTGLVYRDAEGRLSTRFETVRKPRRRDVEPASAVRFGVSFFGLWSQGKVIVPDGRFNNVDFHLGRPQYRPRLRLYDGAIVAPSHGSISKINSPESEWNYSPAILPRSPRDVVWWVSGNNDMTGEVVFDDFLDPGALIYSPMNAAVDNKRRRWRDGFDDKRGEGYVGIPRVQNAAASEMRWRIPRFGRLIGGRIEPVAAGGVVGKGLWLDGDRGRLDYAVPEQPGAEDEMAGASWTTALWVDPREQTLRRRLLTFPDGSWVDLAAGRVTLGAASGAETSIELPPSLRPRPREWTHLAFVSTPARTVVHVQGFELAERGGSFLRPMPGVLTAGRPAGAEVAGFHGWIDELRVVSGPPDPESICNFAHGTLRGLDAETRPGEFASAGELAAAAHQAISARLVSVSRPSYERYRCERERDPDHPCLDAIHLAAGAPGSCVRSGLLFPEGPLYHDLPRPDSRANPFCHTCHVRDHPTPSLRIAGPLKAGRDGTELADDDRRQPLQAPRRIHGFLPAGLLGLETDRDAPPEGLPLDRWLYPGARKALGVE